MLIASLLSPKAISIHALREEGDYRLESAGIPDHDFYPRPPRGGRRLTAQRMQNVKYFYPRPPRGGRPQHAKDRPHP